MRGLVPLAARRAPPALPAPPPAPRAPRVLADSQATAADVRRFLHVPADRLDVVPLGLGVTSGGTPEPEAVLRDRHRLGGRRVALSVSAKRPHKNLLRLIEALAAMPVGQRPVLVI